MLPKYWAGQLESMCLKYIKIPPLLNNKYECIYMVTLGCICHVCTYFQSRKRLRLHLYQRYIYFDHGSFAENNCSAIMHDKIEKHVKLHLLPQEIHYNGFAVCLWNTISSGILPSSLSLFLSFV